MLHEVHIWELVFDDAGNIETWRLVDANPAALNSWKKNLSAIVGKTSEEVFPNSNATGLFMPVVKRIFTEGKPHIWEMNFPYTNQFLRMISIPVDDYFISTGFDITERKQVENKLAKNERSLATMLDNTHDAVVRIDCHLRHIYANSALYKTTGLTPEQYLGKTNEEIGLPGHLCSYWKTKHQEVFATGEPVHFEFDFPTFDKGARTFQAAVCPEFNDNMEAETIISFMRDITGFKNAESAKTQL